MFYLPPELALASGGDHIVGDIDAFIEYVESGQALRDWHERLAILTEECDAFLREHSLVMRSRDASTAELMYSYAACMSVRHLTLLEDSSSRQIHVAIDYVACVSDSDVFVVGYGLDWNEQYRHLPDICVLEP